MTRRVKVTVVSLKQPCSACLIIYGIIKEMLEKIQKDFEFVDIEYVELDNLKQVHSISGLEVEKFPALIINDEQLTAGSIPAKEQLISIIRNEAEIDGKN